MSTAAENHSGAADPSLEVLAQLERTRRELRLHEERFALAIRGSNDGLWDWDLITNELYLSPRWKAMLGYRDDELPSSYAAWVSLLHPDDRGAALTTVESFLAKGAGQFILEHRLRHKDGSYRWTLSRGALDHAEDGRPRRLAGWLTDITEQKEAAETARKRTRQQAAVAELGERALSAPNLETLIDHAACLVSSILAVDYMAVKELMPDDATLCYRGGIGWDPDIFGDVCFPLSDGFLGGYAIRTRQQVVYSADIDQETRFDTTKYWKPHGFRTGLAVLIPSTVDRPFGCLTVLSRREREFTEHDSSFLTSIGNVLGAWIVRAETDNQLRQREEEYRAIFEAVSDGLSIFDLESRKVVAVNPALADMHGYTREEMIGLESLRWIHPDYHDVRDEIYEKSAAGEPFSITSVDVRKNGETFPVEVRGRPFRYRGRPHLLSVIRDVTEQERVRALLEQRIATLSHIAANLTFGQPIGDMLNELASDVVASSGAVVAAVGLVIDDQANQRLVGLHGIPEVYRPVAEALWSSGAVMPTIRATTERQPIIERDVRAYMLNDARYDPVAPLIRSVKWDIIVAVPMVVRNKAVGTLVTGYRPDSAPSDDEIAFLSAIADQAAIAIENVELLAAAQEAAVLEERQRLARELHDSVSHALFDVGLGARSARSWIERDPQRAVEPLDYVLEMVEAGLAEMRSLLLELRPETLERDGLVEALERNATALRRRHGLQVDAEFEAEPDLSLADKEAGYRIVREAMHNIVKHANATKVTIRMWSEPSRVVFVIQDNGVGFEPAHTYPGHLGLRSMRERAERAGGCWQINSAPGQGTAVRLDLPREEGAVLACPPEPPVNESPVHETRPVAGVPSD